MPLDFPTSTYPKVLPSKSRNVQRMPVKSPGLQIPGAQRWKASIVVHLDWCFEEGLRQGLKDDFLFLDSPFVSKTPCMIHQQALEVVMTGRGHAYWISAVRVCFEALLVSAERSCWTIPCRRCCRHMYAQSLTHHELGLAGRVEEPLLAWRSGVHCQSPCSKGGRESEPVAVLVCKHPQVALQISHPQSDELHLEQQDGEVRQAQMSRM